MEYLKDVPDKYFELAVVDPPYGIGEDGAKNHTRGGLAKPKLYTAKNWDNFLPDSEYFDFLKRKSKNQIIWGANHFIDNIPFNLNSSCWLVWDKVNGDNDFADCELAWTSHKTAVRKFTFKWAGMFQEDMKNKEVRIHPTQKPVKLYEWLLMNYAKEGDKILDTHLGSGSSRIAAYNLGFEFVGIELDKEYFEAQEKRFNQHISQLTLF
jgi:site-specific DNA-methyltransferase (adenine-specific)